jgi:hypothetical protein
MLVRPTVRDGDHARRRAARTSAAGSVVLQGDRVGGDVHLRLVLGQFDDAPFELIFRPQLAATSLAGSVELIDRRLVATRTTELHGGDGSAYDRLVMSEPPMSIEESEIGVDRPNYLVRRLIVTALVVVGIAVVALVVGRLIDSGGSQSGAVDVDTSWDTVVLVNERTGRIAMSPPDGSEVENISTNTGIVSGAAMIDDMVFVTGARTSVAVQLTGDQPRVDISDLLDGDLALSRPIGTNELVLFSNGTDGVFMGADPEQWIDTAEVVDAPGVALGLDDATANVDGSALLIPDLGNFQSVLVRFGDEPATYFAGVPLAVDDERVATVQTVGGDATVTLSDHDGTELFQSTTKPVLAAMLVDDGIITVDSGGMIHRITIDDEELVGAIGAAPVAGRSWIATTGDRLLVTTARGISVLDDSGEVIATSDRTAVAVTGPAPASDVPLRPACQPLHDPNTGALQLLDLRDGDTIAEAPMVADDVLTSADGCLAVAVERAPDGDGEGSGDRKLAMSSEGVAPIEPADIEVIALSPDGETIVVSVDGRLVAEPLTAPEADATDDSAENADADADNADAETDDEERSDDLGPVTPHVFFADL